MEPRGLQTRGCAGLGTPNLKVRGSISIPGLHRVIGNVIPAFLVY